MNNDVLTLEQLRTVLGVKENTIKTLIRKNEFPEPVLAKKGNVANFYLAALLDWFESMEAKICQC